MNDIRNLFVDANEREIATLGGTYLKNYLTTGMMENGFCTVTDKRVYFRGKCYTKNGSHYKSTREEKAVDLQDVTGSGYVVTKHFWLLILAVLSSIFSILMVVSMIMGYASESVINEFISLDLLPIAALWISYFLLKFRMFEITFAGGKIAFTASSYNEAEINEFQRALRQAKDNYKEAASTMVFNNNSGSAADELRKYKELLDDGVITQAEFENAKSKILG